MSIGAFGGRRLSKPIGDPEEDAPIATLGKAGVFAPSETRAVGAVFPLCSRKLPSGGRRFCANNATCPGFAERSAERLRTVFMRRVMGRRPQSERIIRSCGLGPRYGPVPCGFPAGAGCLPLGGGHSTVLSAAISLISLHAYLHSLRVRSILCVAEPRGFLSTVMLTIMINLMQKVGCRAGHLTHPV